MDLTDELVQFAETLVSRKTGSDLSFVQKVILRESLSENSKTYSQIAKEVRYSETYIKQLVAPKLWQLLSSILSEKVNKTNCRSLLAHKLRSEPALLQGNPSHTVGLESPEGQVPLNSTLYVERDGVESLSYEEVLRPGGFIRIKAPRRMGKTSLMTRILAQAQAQNYTTVRLNLQAAGSPVFESINTFLRWFCVFISKKLKLVPQLDDYWDEDIGPLVSSTLYFEEYLLNQQDSPMVLALDELNYIFEYPTVAKDFLALLRSWHEESKDESAWHKLRFILLHSTDLFIPLETYQSPFNIGLAIELLPLTREQVQDLGSRQGVTLSTQYLSQFMQVSGGFPYLVRRAFYQSLRDKIELGALLTEAMETGGIYQGYLRSLWQRLEREPALKTGVQAILEQRPVVLDLETSAKLWGLGLIRWQSDRLHLSCDLYQSYFQAQFEAGF